MDLIVIVIWSGSACNMNMVNKLSVIECTDNVNFIIDSIIYYMYDSFGIV